MKLYQMRWAQKYWGKEARERYRRYLQSDAWKAKRQVRFTSYWVPMLSMWRTRNGVHLLGSSLKLEADGTLFLELALRGYDLSKLRDEETTAGILKLA